MESIWHGNILSLHLTGESHGDSIGAAISGLPSGYAINQISLEKFMSRRAPGRHEWSSPRNEQDIVTIVSGVKQDATDGETLRVTIANNDVRSTDYEAMRHIPRPGHADYAARLRYGKDIDLRGGGHFSGRLTAPLCAIGNIAMQILRQHDIIIGAHIAAIDGIADQSFHKVKLSKIELTSPGEKDFPVIDDTIGDRMKAAIKSAQKDGDSVGGVIEIAAINVPAGLGNPWFDGIENCLSQLFFAIPAVRGVEFGAGFDAAKMHGSKHNDAFIFDKDGKIKTKTNNCGGILGGITDGMPLVARICIKPTPSIAIPQDSIDLVNGEPVRVSVPGRHDPCIVPRAVPVAEAMMAIGLLDFFLTTTKTCHTSCEFLSSMDQI